MFARTRRLTLRPGWPEDAPALAQAIGHREVIENLARPPWPYGLSDAEQYLAIHGDPTSAKFLIFDSPTDAPRLIGGIGLQPDERPGEYELAYWFTPQAWGRGYATEAGRQAVQIARHALGLKRLNAGYFVDNPASGRVLAKLGFRPTGRTVPLFCRARGHDVPCVKVELDLESDRRCEERLAA